jgi:hypothetical protein
MSDTQPATAGELRYAGAVAPGVRRPKEVSRKVSTAWAQCEACGLRLLLLLPAVR